MTKRIILAGVLGGIALFLWEGLAHTVLPLGLAGVKALPNEDAVTAGLRQNLRESGFYFFPAAEMTPGLTAEQQKAVAARADEQVRTGTSGIMVVYPHGRDFSFGRGLVIQGLGDILLCLIAAFLVAQAVWLPYLGRVAFVGLLGLFPFLASDFPFWTWYGFPIEFTVAQLTVHVVGFLVAGLVIAAIVRAAPMLGYEPMRG